MAKLVQIAHFTPACKKGVPMESAQTFKKIAVEDVGNVKIITLPKARHFDRNNAQQIGAELFSLVIAGHIRLILSFSGVEYFDSVALGKMITLNKMLQAQDGKLVLCDVDPGIMEVFEITKLDKFFTITGTQEQALEAF